MPTATSGEFFILENRQQQGFDSWLLGHGLLIWHVHSQMATATSSNVNISHPQKLYPVCAAATENPGDSAYTYGPINTDSCTFPGRDNKRAFTSTTIPSAVSWNGTATGKNLDFITETNNNVSFVVNPSISMSGSNSICPGYSETFTINNLPSGVTASWTCSANLTITSYSASSATIANTMLLNGDSSTLLQPILLSSGWVRAELSNSNGNAFQKTLDVNRNVVTDIKTS